MAQLYNYKHHNRNSKREFPLLISSTWNKRLTIHHRTWLILYRYTSRILFFFFFFFYNFLWVLLFVNYLRFGQFYKVFPPDNGTKNKIKSIKRWIYGSILSIGKCSSRGNLTFDVTVLSEYIHLIFSRICLWCYCLNALHWM